MRGLKKFKSSPAVYMYIYYHHPEFISEYCGFPRRGLRLTWTKTTTKTERRETDGKVIVTNEMNILV